MLDRLVQFFTSLKLTVVLLALGLVLVFWGTLAQVHLGLYKAQNEFFRSFFIFWQPGATGLRIPIFPGGYLIGGLLLINLLAAHLRYYQPGKRKIGIVLIHLGVVLLLRRPVAHGSAVHRKHACTCATARRRIIPKPTAATNWPSWTPPTPTRTRSWPFRARLLAEGGDVHCSRTAVHGPGEDLLPQLVARGKAGAGLRAGENHGRRRRGRLVEGTAA